MRIAQVMLGKGFGGAERSFVDLTRALAARGHSVLAIGEQRGRALGLLDGQANIECAAIRCLGNWDLLAAAAIRRQLARFAPQLMQAHLARAAHLGGRAARALGIATVAKTHDLVDLAYYRNIDMLVPTTAAQLEHLRAHGIAADAICRIPNFSAVAPVADIKPHEPGQVRIKSLGRFVQKKGFDVLLQAFAQVAATGLDARLVLGGDGPERSQLERHAHALGLAGSVEFPGWVDDVNGFLDDAHLFALPSRDEPFGIVLLEAMARGIPIVCTPCAGPREILNAAAAYFATGFDAHAFADALIQAMGEPTKTAARALAALQRFKDCYSDDVVVDRYLALYAKLID